MVFAKEKNPIENTNILSYCTFTWFLPTILKGYRKPLTKEDLFPILLNQKSSYLGDCLEKAWHEELTKRKPSLWSSIIKVFWKQFLIKILLVIIVELILRPCQGLSFILLLKYFNSNTDIITKREAYIYAVSLFVCNLGTIIGTHLYVWGTQVIMMEVRVACCSLIYRKSLRICQNSKGSVTVGQLVNYMTNDANRFDFLATFMHSLWVMPLQIIVVMVILYFITGWTGIIGLLFYIAFIPVQTAITKLISKLRLEVAKITDERVKAMSEILSGIHVIKAFSWEDYFKTFISKIRSLEIRKRDRIFLCIGLLNSITSFIPKLGIFISIVVYVLMGNVLTTVYVFTLIILYVNLRNMVNIFFPNALFRGAEFRVSLNRIQEFLQSNEMQNTDVGNKNLSATSACFIAFQNVSAKWGNSSPENILEKITLKINKNQLVAVIGSVGSGKTCLLNSILQETFLTSGKINVFGDISYSPQVSWFFRGTVKENILFNEPYEENRYKSVIKICALERDLDAFRDGDNTIIIEDGGNLSGGQRARINLARAVYRNADIYLLDDPLSAVDGTVGEIIFHECICNFLKDKTVILVTNQIQFLKYVDYIYLMENGKITFEGTYEKCQSKKIAFEWISQASDEEENPLIKEIVRKDDSKQKSTKIFYDEGENVTQPSIRLYGIYFKVSRKYGLLIFAFITLILYGFGYALFDVSVNVWGYIDADILNNGTWKITNYHSISRKDCLIILSSIMIIIMVTAIIVLMTLLKIFLHCAKKLHDLAFEKVIVAPMKFFHTNTSGSILNRFSRDLGLVDDYIPTIFADCLMSTICIVGCVVTISAISYWFAIPVLISFVCVYYLRRLNLPANLSIKRLEGTTKSPVYTLLKTSFKGLTVLRAFKKQKDYIKLFDDTQDAHTSSSFMYITTSHTMGVVIDGLFVGLTAIITIGLFLLEDTHANFAGLVLSLSINLLSLVQWIVRQSCELDITMTSVERISEYFNLERDGDSHERDVKPSKYWPHSGLIEFINVNLRYERKSKEVLKNLNFTIEPLRKVGIVGRTGAGKSSICASLFQLAYTDGIIRIDGIDIRKIPLDVLRSRISIIPQEPLLFSDTIRRNLDPFDEFSDIELWQALAEVELKQVIAEMPEGILTKLTEGGSNLSVGQRQLMCLARALVRKNKILVIDEATANVDPKTDALIQRTIRDKIKNCTVLTVAHRLHTIIDSDLVLVIDNGEIVEFDHPHLLLGNKGMFYDMVQKTGQSNARNLYKIAEEKFKRINMI